MQAVAQHADWSNGIVLCSELEAGAQPKYGLETLFDQRMSETWGGLSLSLRLSRRLGRRMLRRLPWRGRP